MLVGTGKFSSMIVPLSSSREINVKSQSWAKLTIPWKYFFYFQDCHDLAFVQKAWRVNASEDSLKKSLCTCLLNSVCTFRYMWCCTTHKWPDLWNKIILTQSCWLCAVHTNMHIWDRAAPRLLRCFFSTMTLGLKICLREAFAGPVPPDWVSTGSFMLVLQYHKETEQGPKPGKFQSFQRKETVKSIILILKLLIL